MDLIVGQLGRFAVHVCGMSARDLRRALDRLSVVIGTPRTRYWARRRSWRGNRRDRRRGMKRFDPSGMTLTGGKGA